jgi:hypothetical protein
MYIHKTCSVTVWNVLNKTLAHTFASLVLYKEKDSNRKCFPADDKKNMNFMNLFSKLW